MKFSLGKQSIGDKIRQIKKFVKSKRNFLSLYLIVIIVLFIVRLFCPSSSSEDTPTSAIEPQGNDKNVVRDVLDHSSYLDSSFLWRGVKLPVELTLHGAGGKHRIYSVTSYRNCFPDVNDVQMATATQLGIPPQDSRGGLDRYRQDGRLVFIGHSPLYYLKPLFNSSPYLIPRASMLLDRIARNFIDSQLVKQVRPSKLIVTSVLRTAEDIQKLRNYNGNATMNSCHFYGTTFDISYNKYHPIQNPDSASVYATRNDTLRFILSEVLNDLRSQGACYVKYEAKQGCYHITTR